jgi:hypothetical protein
MAERGDQKTGRVATLIGWGSPGLPGAAGQVEHVSALAFAGDHQAGRSAMPKSPPEHLAEAELL